MVDTTREKQNHKARRALRSFLVFFLVLVVVLGVVVVAAYRDGTGFDVLRRYLNYGSGETIGGETIYDYDAAPSNHFAMVGDRLVVLSKTSLRILDSRGGEVWSTPVQMDQPELVSGGERAVAYDVGGTALWLVSGEGEVMKLTADEEEPFISARLNEKGWLAVTAEKKTYKGWVGVYNENGGLVFEFNSSRRFVTDAYVTDDSKHLAAVTLGQENSVFVSNVVLYDLTKEDPQGNYSINDGLVALIGQQGERLVTVSDTCVTFAGTDGGIDGTYSYRESYLREYDLGGEDFAVLQLNRYQSGSVGRVVSIAADGSVLGSIDVNREILDISASGRYLAVLYMDALVIYNRELQVYATLNGTDYAKAVLMRPDGSALLLASESATLFLP